MYWTVNWLYLLNTSRYQAEIVTQDRYEPGSLLSYKTEN